MDEFSKMSGFGSQSFLKLVVVMFPFSKMF